MVYRTTEPVDRCWICETECDTTCRGCRRAICPTHTLPQQFCRSCDEAYYAFTRSDDLNSKVLVICLGLVVATVVLAVRWPVLAVPGAVVSVACFPIVARVLRRRRARRFLDGIRDRPSVAAQRAEDERDARNAAHRRLLKRRANAPYVE